MNEQRLYELELVVEAIVELIPKSQLIINDIQLDINKELRLRITEIINERTTTT